MPHLRPPRLRAQKRRADALSEAGAGTPLRALRVRIVRVGVEDEMRHAAREVFVGDALEEAGRLVPAQLEARERLCRDAPLAVQVRRRDARTHRLVLPAADVAVVAVRIPELAHRRVGPLPVAQDVARQDVTERRLVLAGEAAFLRQLRHPPVEIALDQRRDGVAPVAEKVPRRLAAVDHVAEERGQAAAHVVALQVAEIVFHPPRPVGPPRLPAVEQDAVHPDGRKRAVQQPPDIAPEVRLDAARIELVALPARRAVGRRAVLEPRIDVTDA